MKKFFFILVFVLIYLPTLSLSGCKRADSKQAVTPTPLEEAELYEGYYYYGENVSSFVPCDAKDEPGPGKGYWLVVNDQFNEMYQAEAINLMNAVAGTLGPGMEWGMYIQFKGIAAPPIDSMSGEGYGYLNQYQGQILVTEAIRMKYFILPFDPDLCKESNK